MQWINSNKLFNESSFSDCGKYRWFLKRRLSLNKRKLIFVGLNPSKANNSRNDPTLTRLIGFSKTWGYGSLVVVNLFARISFSPWGLKCSYDPVGNKNNRQLVIRFLEWANEENCDLWLGWGNKGTFQNRNVEVLEILKRYIQIRNLLSPKTSGPLAIGITKMGQPMHPLYCSSSKQLRYFEEFKRF